MDGAHYSATVLKGKTSEKSGVNMNSASKRSVDLKLAITLANNSKLFMTVLL